MIKDMEKRNYQKELDNLILLQRGYRPTVLLHSCCGPCSSSVLEYLTKYFRVTLLWYNPNLYPVTEFDKRLATQKELIERMNLSSTVDMLTETWKHEEFLAAIAGYEKEPEGGKRCERCFSLRLKECAQLAKEYQFDFFCTTLTVSRYKNAPLINAIGERIAEETGIKWLPSDFKKKGGEMRSAELAEKYQLYRQVHCGCQYSRKQTMALEENRNSRCSDE